MSSTGAFALSLSQLHFAAGGGHLPVLKQLEKAAAAEEKQLLGGGGGGGKKGKKGAKGKKGKDKAAGGDEQGEIFSRTPTVRYVPAPCLCLLQRRLVVLIWGRDEMKPACLPASLPWAGAHRSAPGTPAPQPSPPVQV